MVANSEVSKEKGVWLASPVKGESVFVMQSPPIRDPLEQVSQT